MKIEYCIQSSWWENLVRYKYDILRYIHIIKMLGLTCPFAFAAWAEIAHYPPRHLSGSCPQTAAFQPSQACLLRPSHGSLHHPRQHCGACLCELDRTWATSRGPPMWAQIPHHHAYRNDWRKLHHPNGGLISVDSPISGHAHYHCYFWRRRPCSSDLLFNDLRLRNDLRVLLLDFCVQRLPSLMSDFL